MWEAEVPWKKIKHHWRELVFLILISLNYSSEFHENKCLIKSISKNLKRKLYALKTHLVSQNTKILSLAKGREKMWNPKPAWSI
jgi:hypothetical protein